MKTVRIFAAAAALAAAFSFTAPASACQLVCMSTGRTYNGNLGGLSGADAKCNEEFPGFRFARSYDIVNSLPNAIGIYNSPHKWVGGGITYDVSYGNGEKNFTCNSWTNGSNYANVVTDFGTYVISQNNGYVGMWSAHQKSCSAELPLLCCNM